MELYSFATPNARRACIALEEAGIADLNTAALMAAGAFLGHDYAEHARAHAWLRRCFAHPAARVPGSTLSRFVDLLGH